MINRFLSKKLSSFQIICMGFVGAILLGTLLLRLPPATRSGSPASWEDALFTATSAVCVTGLVVRDTALYWAPFGQAVILILIQVGGLGVVSVAAFIALGTYHDPKDAAKNMVTIRDTFQPNFVNHQVYNKLYKDVYLKLYPSLKSSYQYLWNFAK